MGAFDNIIYSPGEPFQNVYDKVNDTFTALKAGTDNQLWAGNGVGSNPTPKDLWSSDWAISGVTVGAVPLASGWTTHADADERLRYRRSNILGVIQFSGKITSSGTGLTAGTARTVLTMPVGWRPTREIYGIAYKGNDVGIQQQPIMARVDSSGVLTIYNSTSYNEVAGEEWGIYLEYPLT